jgi:2-keto-4-pentenoate hydratase/2-oxohepta-3-ene-1,7-dioic acid hydratase in catechol pathway
VEGAVTNYKILSYGASAREGRAGILIGDDIHDAEKLTGIAAYRTTLGILEDWPTAETALDAAAANPASASRVGPAAAVHILAPILFPGSYFCVAANYRDHHEGMAKRFGHAPQPDPRTRGIKPFHFVKSGKQATVGPDEDFEAPHYGEQLDWEVELAAVIGRPCKRVSAESALDYVAGYTVSNDLSIAIGLI